MFSKKKKRLEISAPSNFEHRVHTGYDQQEQKFTGLPRQWQGIIEESAKRPKPLVDPVCITAIQHGSQKVGGFRGRGAQIWLGFVPPPLSRGATQQVRWQLGPCNPPGPLDVSTTSPRPHPHGKKKTKKVLQGNPKNPTRKPQKVPAPSPPHACSPPAAVTSFFKVWLVCPPQLLSSSPSPSFGPRHLPSALLAPATGPLWLDAPRARKKRGRGCAPRGWTPIFGSDDTWKPPGRARDSAGRALRLWGSQGCSPLPLRGSASSH